MDYYQTETQIHIRLARRLLLQLSPTGFKQFDARRKKKRGKFFTKKNERVPGRSATLQPTWRLKQKISRPLTKTFI